MYNGTVTNRADGKPLCGIPVSDGRNTVLTDENGRFSLPGWERARVINVGVLTYRHNDWFINIEGHTGDFDFVIEKIDTPSDFCFFHNSDTEIEWHGFVDFVSVMHDEVKKHHPAFYIHTGDLCRESGVNRHYLAMNSETIGCPVRYCIGNHDYIGKTYGEEVYERFYGPVWYSFDCGNIHFVALPIGVGDNPSGYEYADAYRWLIKDLAELRGDKRLVVLDHDNCAEDETGFVRTAGEVTVNFRENGLLAWIFGHFHHNNLNCTDGVFNICSSRVDSGGIDSSAGAIRKIVISGENLASEMLYFIPDGKNEPSDECMWSTKLNGIIEFSDPLEIDGDIYIGTSDDGYPKNCGVYRLDGETGDIKWFFPTENSVKGDVAYDSGRIYAQDCEGRLYCIDAETGALIWRQVSKLTRLTYTRCGVLVVDGRVIAGNHNTVYAYDCRDGSLLWKNDLGGGEKTPAKFVYDEKRNHIILSLHWNCIASVDAATGKTAWQTAGMPVRFRTATPYVDGDVVYTCGMGDFCALNAENGEMIVTSKSSARVDVAGQPADDGKMLYYPTGNSGVVAADKTTLTPVRTFDAGEARLFTSPYIFGKISTVESSPIIVGDMLVFTSSDGCLYFYDKNTAILLHRIVVGNPCTASPVLTDSYAVIADFCGNVKKIPLRL